MSTGPNSGFWNAHYNSTTETYDRLYNADTFNKYFKGVISQYGVFANYGDQCITSYSGFDVTVATGKLMINGHWYLIDGDPEVITLDGPTANAIGVRIDILVAQLDTANRVMSLEVIKGIHGHGKPSLLGWKPKPPSEEDQEIENLSEDAKYVIDENAALIQMPLADFSIWPGSTGITSSTDYRGTSRCPYICHLIVGPDEIDIQKFISDLWDTLTDWGNHIQEDLQINTYIQSYQQIVDGTAGGGTNEIELDLGANYSYSEGDQIFAFYNGFSLTRDLVNPSTGAPLPGCFKIDTESHSVPYLIFNGAMDANDRLEIIALKSQIGVPDYINGDRIKY